jgi:hypothetical protein
VRALSYAHAISPNVTAVHITDDREDARQLEEQWDRWAGDIPLVVIESPYRSFTLPFLSHGWIEDDDPNGDPVVLPEFPKHWWQTSSKSRRPALQGGAAVPQGHRRIDVPQHFDESPPVSRSPPSGRE